MMESSGFRLSRRQVLIELTTLLGCIFFLSIFQAANLQWISFFFFCIHLQSLQLTHMSCMVMYLQRRQNTKTEWSFRIPEGPRTGRTTAAPSSSRRRRRRRGRHCRWRRRTWFSWCTRRPRRMRSVASAARRRRRSSGATSAATTAHAGCCAPRCGRGGRACGGARRPPGRTCGGREEVGAEGAEDVGDGRTRSHGARRSTRAPRRRRAEQRGAPPMRKLRERVASYTLSTANDDGAPAPGLRSTARYVPRVSLCARSAGRSAGTNSAPPPPREQRGVGRRGERRRQLQHAVRARDARRCRCTGGRGTAASGTARTWTGPGTARATPRSTPSSPWSRTPRPSPRTTPPLSAPAPSRSRAACKRPNTSSSSAPASSIAIAMARTTKLSLDTHAWSSMAAWMIDHLWDGDTLRPRRHAALTNLFVFVFVFLKLLLLPLVTILTHALITPTTSSPHSATYTQIKAANDSALITHAQATNHIKNITVRLTQCMQQHSVRLPVEIRCTRTYFIWS